MKNLLLFGLPFSGKSTVGKLVAKNLKREFIDTDIELEVKTGLSCKKLFKSRGENDFRALENEILKGLSAKENCVISLGGGTMTHPANEKSAKALGLLFYLKCDEKTLKERLESQKKTPSYLDNISFEELVKNRQLYYEKLADFIIETKGFSQEQIADQIGKTLGKQLLRSTF